MPLPAPRVLIIGAGPAGLAAAVELTRLGARVCIVDQRESRTRESRAVAVNPRTLDLLEPSGVTPRLLAAGVRLKGIRLFSRGRTAARIDVTRMRHRYPFLLSLPQSETERILEERLSDLGGAVERRVRLVDVKLKSRVEAVLEGAARETLAPDWILGADGRTPWCEKRSARASRASANPSSGA